MVLGGSWVVKSRIISRVTLLPILGDLYIYIYITSLITTFYRLLPLEERKHEHTFIYSNYERRFRECSIHVTCLYR